MLTPVRALVRFMESGDRTHLRGAFSTRGVTIVENFAPFIFSGDGVVARWSAGFLEHAREMSGLRATFGEAKDFGVRGARAYFALPTTWRGRDAGHAFIERGAWVFVLQRTGPAWRIAAYAWGVTQGGPPHVKSASRASDRATRMSRSVHRQAK